MTEQEKIQQMHTSQLSSFITNMVISGENSCYRCPAAYKCSHIEYGCKAQIKKWLQSEVKT